MILADTSVWIDYLKGSPKIKSAFNQLLQKRKIFALSVVFGELLQGVRNRREREVIMRFWNNLPKIDERDLLIEAGNIANLNKLYCKGVGLLDCYILAAAMRKDISIWTFDKKLESVIGNLTV